MHKQTRQLLFYFIFLIGIICSLTPIGSVLAQSADNWSNLRSAPPELLKQVAADYASDTNQNHPKDVSSMQLLQVQKPKAKPLYLVNTRQLSQTPDANPTCGQAGCLFYGYTQSKGKFVQVLNGYINDFRLKNAPPVIQPTNQVVNQLPCLLLTSYQNQSQQLMRSKLCFDGKDYQPTQPSTQLKQPAP